MNLYYPPTKIEGRWRDGVIIVIGLWLSVLGAFSWWADYLFSTIPEVSKEWSSDDKKESLSRLINRAKEQGVIEPTQEQKFELLFEP